MKYCVKYDEKIALFGFYVDALMFTQTLKDRGVQYTLSKVVWTLTTTADYSGFFILIYNFTWQILIYNVKYNHKLNKYVKDLLWKL